MVDSPSIQITTPAGATDAVTTSLSGTASGLNFNMVYVYDNGVFAGLAGVYGGRWSATVAPNPGDNSYVATGYARTDPGVSSAAVVLTDVRTPPTVTVDQAGGNTDAATQTLSGTATTAGYGARFTAGTTLTLSDDGAVVGHAEVGSDGTWRATVALASQGRNLISISDTDAIGNLGEGDTYFSLKTTVPAVAITSPGGAVYRPLQVISGTATAGDVGDLVTVSEDGSAIGSVAVGLDGAWSLTTTLAAGPHTFAATDADRYGNVGTSGTVGYTLLPNPTPPTIAFSADGVATNAAAQVLSGTVASSGGPSLVAGQVIAVSEDGHQLGQAVVGRDGTWSMPVTLPHLGQNLLSATVQDAAGNTGYGGASYLYETAAHAVAIASPGGLTNQPVQRITGTATAMDSIALTDDGTVVGSTTTNADGTWWVDATLTTQGANLLQAVDTSPAGNVGTSGTVGYTLDTLPPAVAITSGATTVRAASDTETVTGTAEVGSAVALFDDGAPSGTAAVGPDGTWSAQVALHAGPNGITAQARDAAGNVGTSGAVLDTLDTTPVLPPAPAPSVSIASAGGLTNKAAATVSGQATANSAVTLFDDGNAVASTTAGADGSWALGLTLAQGVNVLTALDATAAGVAGSDAIAAVLDTVPPAVSFGAAPQLSGTAATLTGTATDGSGIRGVELFDGSTDLGAAQLRGDGSWVFSHDFGQGTFDHLTAVATDAAGNSAAAAALFDLDTAPAGRRSTGAVKTTDAGGAVTAVTTTAADGSVGAQTVRNADGTATSIAYENGQSLFSIGDDVMTGVGMREDFVFGPAMGHARITDFVVDGPGHDTITLSHADFADVAQVLARTTMSHGAAVIHASPTDTIRLVGVTKADLVQHRGDFAFTG